MELAAVSFLVICGVCAIVYAGLHRQVDAKAGAADSPASGEGGDDQPQADNDASV